MHLLFYNRNYIHPENAEKDYKISIYEYTVIHTLKNCECSEECEKMNTPICLIPCCIPAMTSPLVYVYLLMNWTAWSLLVWIILQSVTNFGIQWQSKIGVKSSEQAFALVHSLCCQMPGSRNPQQIPHMLSVSCWHIDELCPKALNLSNLQIYAVAGLLFMLSFQNQDIFQFYIFKTVSFVSWLYFR